MRLPAGIHSLSRRLIAGVLVAVVLGGASFARAQSADDLYRLGRGYYLQERWKLAADAFGKFVTNHPTHARAATASFYQGSALINLKDYKAARPVWQRFVKNFPKDKNHPVAMYRAGECSYLLNDLKTAETAFQAYLNKNPKHEYAEWAYPFLAETQFYLKKPAAALKSYRAAIDQFPKGRFLDDAKYGVARCHQALGNPDDAVKAFGEIANDPTAAFAAQAQENIASIQFDRGRYSDAAAAYDDLVRNFPRSELAPRSRLASGFSWYQVGDYRKAISRFEEAAKSPEQKVTADYWTGISYKSLGEFRQAAASFKVAYNEAKGGPLSERILYQWAGSELAAGNYLSARDLYLRLVREKPQSKLAPDSQYFAAESAFLHARTTEAPNERAERLAVAERINQQGKVDFPRSALRHQREVLEGRILDLKGGEPNLQAASRVLQAVADGDAHPNTKLDAKFYLIRTLQKLGKHREVASLAAPLIAQVEKKGAVSKYVGALLIVLNSELEAQHDENAVKLAKQFLDLMPNSREGDVALAVRAVANFRLGNKEAAKRDLKSLEDRYASSPLLPEKTLQIAELSYDRADWPFAVELFDSLVQLGPKSNYYISGLSGLAWSEFSQGKYAQAAADFARVVEAAPNDLDHAPEAAFMLGQALEKDEQLKLAATKYADAFTKFAPRQPAAAGDEKKRPLKFPFLAGLQAARLQERLEQPQESHTAYEQLLSKFPDAETLDQLLDEWALMNLRADRFAQSDDVFRRLIKERPESELADNAQLSLAESAFIAGRLAEAKKSFQELSTSKKSDPEVRERSLFQLMEIAAEGRSWTDVEQAADKLTSEFSNSTYADTAKFRTGEAKLNLAKLDDAVAALKPLRERAADAALAKQPWFPRVFVLLAEAYVRQKKYDEVEQTVAGFRRWDPENSRLYEADEILGRSFKNRAKWTEARAAFGRALAEPSARGTEVAAKAQLMIGETWWHEKEFEKAQGAYLKVFLLHRYPEWQAPALLQAGLCDEQLMQWEKAAKTYRQVIDKFAKSEYAAKAKERWQIVRRKLGSG